MKKKCFAIFLIIMMLCSILPTSAFAGAAEKEAFKEDKIEVKGIVYPRNIAEDEISNPAEKEDGTDLYKDEMIVLELKQVWEDDNDQEGLRPKEETVRIWADGRVIEEIRLTATEGWMKTLMDLPKYNDRGNAVEYAVEKDSLFGYINETKQVTPYHFVLTDTLEPAEQNKGEIEEEDLNVGGNEKPEVKPDTDPTEPQKGTIEEEKHPAGEKKPAYDTPETGDNSHAGLYGMIMVCSLGMLFGVVAINKNRKSNEK